VDTASRHVLGEYWDCDRALLDDRAQLEQLMKRSAEAAHATVVATAFHRLEPQGVSGVVVLEESHFSVHTWPEVGYAAVDFFTCGTCDPEAGHRLLCEALGAARAEVMVLERGQQDSGSAIRVVRHDPEPGTAAQPRPQTAFVFAGD
jgi:S-adenosylmethionine decarboxylase proenzyme